MFCSTLAGTPGFVHLLCSTSWHKNSERTVKFLSWLYSCHKSTLNFGCLPCELTIAHKTLFVNNPILSHFPCFYYLFSFLMVEKKSTYSSNILSSWLSMRQH